MKSISRHFIAIAFVFLVCSCATTSLKKTWKSPDYHGKPVSKIAVLVVDDRNLVREILEGNTTGRLMDRGQQAFRVHELLTLADIKADKNSAAERLRAKGADTVLIMRLIDSAVQTKGSRDFRQKSSGSYATVISGTWFDFYILAWSGNTSNVRGTLKRGLLIQSSLFDLTTEKPLWSCVTETKVKEDDDKLELMKPLVLTIVDSMAADGVIR